MQIFILIKNHDYEYVLITTKSYDTLAVGRVIATLSIPNFHLEKSS